MVTSPVYTTENECQDCYKCVRHCPVKAIRIVDGKASVIPEACVACGECVKVCPAHGMIIIMMSLFFLPLILISPKKFALLFALGTFVSISSFIFYYGTLKFVELLFNKDRIWFTVIYLTGFLGCLFFPTFFGKSYFIILMFSGLELISTLFFILTFLPGGYASIRIFTNLFISQVKRLFNR